MISTVLFDMNDVLCRYDRSVRVARLAELSGRSADEVDQAIWGSGFEDEGDAGVMDAEVYLEEFGRRLNVPLSQGAWADALRAAVTPIPETLALARGAGTRARIAVLTNNNLMVKRVIGVIFPELEPIFGTDFYVSAEFRARKPDPEAYLRCLAALGARPEDALFIDDSRKNVEGAEAAGLRTHLYRDSASLASAFRDMGLLKA